MQMLECSPHLVSFSAAVGIAILRSKHQCHEFAAPALLSSPSVVHSLSGSTIVYVLFKLSRAKPLVSPARMSSPGTLAQEQAPTNENAADLTTVSTLLLNEDGEVEAVSFPSSFYHLY